MPASLPSLPSTDAQSRLQEAVTTTNNLNSSSLTKANALRTAISTADSAIESLPPPLNVAAKTLVKSIYEILSSGAAPPLDVDRALNLMPGTQREQIDPIKLFVLLFAFAIIKAIWCFIKSILHPLPFIGRFFPLCLVTDDGFVDLPQSGGRRVQPINQGNLTTFGQGVGAATAPVVGQPTLVFPPAPVPQEVPRGQSFDEYLQQAAPPPSPSTRQQPSADSQGNPPAPTPPPTPVQYQISSTTDDQLRRLFGL